MTFTQALDISTIDALDTLHREVTQHGAVLALGSVRVRSPRCSNAVGWPIASDPGRINRRLDDAIAGVATSNDLAAPGTAQ